MEQLELILKEKASDKDYAEILSHYKNMKGDKRKEEREWLSTKLKTLSQSEVKDMIAYVKKHDSASGTSMGLLKIKDDK